MIVVHSPEGTAPSHPPAGPSRVRLGGVTRRVLRRVSELQGQVGTCLPTACSSSEAVGSPQGLSTPADSSYGETRKRDRVADVRTAPAMYQPATTRPAPAGRGRVSIEQARRPPLLGYIDLHPVPPSANVPTPARLGEGRVVEDKQIVAGSLPGGTWEWRTLFQRIRLRQSSQAVLAVVRREEEGS